MPDDLLRRVLELLAGEPTPMGQAPMLAAAEHPTMTKQERQQLLTFLAQIRGRCLARPHEVTHRLVDRIRHPDRRQLAGAKQPRQRHGVTAVGLDPLAGLPWDQRGRDNRAVVTQSLDPGGPTRPPSNRLRRRHAASRDAPPTCRSASRSPPARCRSRQNTGPHRRARHRRSPPRASSSPCQLRRRLRYTSSWSARHA